MGLFDFWKQLFNQKRKRAKKRRAAKRRKKQPLRKFSAKKRKSRVRRKKQSTHVRIKRKRVKRLPSKRRKTKPKNFKKAIRRRPKKNSAQKRAPVEKEIGSITHYFDKISVGIIKLSATLAVGSIIRIAGSKGGFTQAVASMQHNHKEITYAEKGLEVGIKVVKPVREGDKVFLV